MTDIKELVPLLTAASNQTAGHFESVAPFRNVEEKLEELLVANTQTAIMPQLFMTYLFLEHVLTILTGDIRYHEESSALCLEIFRVTGKLLKSLAELIQEESHNLDEFEQYFRESVMIYLGNTTKINSLLEINK